MCLTQTTLSLDDVVGISEALKRKFPEMKAPAKDDICYERRIARTPSERWPGALMR